jgi:hypothetical protein
MDINIKETKPKEIKRGESGKCAIEKDITAQVERHDMEELY